MKFFAVASIFDDFKCLIMSLSIAHLNKWSNRPSAFLRDLKNMFWVFWACSYFHSPVPSLPLSPSLKSTPFCSRFLRFDHCFFWSGLSATTVFHLILFSADHESFILLFFELILRSVELSFLSSAILHWSVIFFLPSMTEHQRIWLYKNPVGATRN